MVPHPYCPSSGREDYEFGVRRVDCKVRLHHKNKLGKAESRKGREGWGITMLRVLSTPKHIRWTASNILKEQGWTRN